MDNLLVPYLTSHDDREQQQQLDVVLTVHAAPIIRQVLRRRLGFYVSTQGVNENYQDPEDLYQEAMTRVIQLLNRLQSSSAPDIKNFEQYVSRIATNICIDFLRAKSPARTRLKDSLRDLLKRHKDLVSWEHEGEILCGFASWRGTGKSAFSDQSYQDLATKLASFQSVHFADEDVRLAPVSQIVAELFNWIGSPVELNVLVRLVSYVLDIKDPQIESFHTPFCV